MQRDTQIIIIMIIIIRIMINHDRMLNSKIINCYLATMFSVQFLYIIYFFNVLLVCMCVYVLE